jgi:hypothetical protein
MTSLPPGLAARPRAGKLDRGVGILLSPSMWHWQQLVFSKRPTTHDDHGHVCFLTLLSVLDMLYVPDRWQST